MVEDVIEALRTAFEWNPYLLFFLVSFVGNAVPYMTVPYLIGLTVYSAVITDPLVRVGVAVAGGVGAGLGKVVVFLIGRGVHRLVPEEQRREMEYLLRRFGKGTFIAVFLVAALPLPDDVLYVPLGVAGYSLPLFALAVILGKIVITFAAVLLGAGISWLAGGEVDSVGVSVVAAVVGIVLSVMVARIRWSRVFRAYDEKGVVGFIVVLVEEAVLALLPRRKRFNGGSSRNGGDGGVED